MGGLWSGKREVMPGAAIGVNRGGLERCRCERQIAGMVKDSRLQLDMTPDGGFRTPPGLTLSTRIMAVAVLVAVVAGAVAFAAFALWIALLLIPVFLLAVLIAVGMLRFQMWRARRRAYAARDIRPL